MSFLEEATPECSPQGQVGSLYRRAGCGRGALDVWSISVGPVVLGNKSGGRRRLGFHLTQGDQLSRCAWDWRVSQDMELSVRTLGKSWAAGKN